MGQNTPNSLFYLPDLGASGAAEKSKFDAALTATDAVITAKAAKGANSDITSLSGLTTALTIGQGGTGNTSGIATNLSGTPLLPTGTTAHTYSQADNATHIATTAYVDTGLGTKPTTTYAQGDWTAGLTCGTSGTITLNTGYKTGAYVKIGRMVTVTGFFYVDSVSSPVGELYLTGLPFTSGAAANKFRAGVSVYANGLAVTAITSIMGFVQEGVTQINLKKFSAGSVGVLAGDVVGASNFIITATYFTD